MTRSISLGLLLGVLLVSNGFSQSYYYSAQKFVPQNYSLKDAFKDTMNNGSDFPDPKKVLRRSLIIPGWGQVTNKQIWKVPIVYGMLGGLTYYSVYLHVKYHDYRAAFYNLNPDTPNDNRFGSTPDYIPENSNLSALRQNRNYFRNRRDLVYVFIGLAYALNAIDAYVFAHLRPFDVSDDLSMKVSMKPDVMAIAYAPPAPSISLSINF
ncbi:MAG TPA: DUF5683 domain-containing protein [Gracilimonas sp.]|uniref:DUF5683 domain-containing protein n=1 Tax=Gracilimonas sp. TaxID=1974203 RepID=UPI002D888B9F|nr:DUF5683 domain-containing protein [Gracilimonas sp.]